MNETRYMYVPLVATEDQYNEGIDSDTLDLLIEETRRQMFAKDNISLTDGVQIPKDDPLFVSEKELLRQSHPGLRLVRLIRYRFFQIEQGTDVNLLQ